MGNHKVKRPQSLRSTAFRGASVTAIGLSMALLSGVAFAQTPPASDPQDSDIALETLRVEDSTIDTNPYAQPGAPYNARVSGDARHVAPLAETPQTITVITQAAIQDSGLTDLRDIVSAQPGVTVGTGENGNAFGDRYIIRGQEARSDVFIDGLRDAGITTRESFAVDQIEISKGPNSTFAGRGTAGGAINSITKQASADYNFNRIQAGMGTDGYRRVTLDSNIPLGETFAVRANLLHAFEEVPDRGPADRERNGAAVSAAWDVTPRFNLTGDYYYLKAEDTPDLGSYMVGTVPARAPVSNPPVYAQTNDFLNTESNIATLRMSYEFSPSFRITNAVRYNTTDNDYVVTGGRQATRGANDAAPGVNTVTLSTHQGWQEVEYFVDNLNVYLDVGSGAVKHQFVLGAEYSDLSVLNGVYSVTNNANNCITNTGVTNNAFCILGPTGAPIANANSAYHASIARGVSDSDYNIKTLSLYVMDTVKIGEHWSVFGGLRWDDYDYSNVTGTTTKTLYSFSDSFWSGHAGIVYSLNDDVNFYASYSTASEINGGESDVTSCSYGGICASTPAQFQFSEPELAENFEVGAKIVLFNDQLLFTAALFRTDKSKVMETEATGAGYTNFGTLNTGGSRVSGLELGLSGNITDRLSAQAGVAVMRSEVTKSAVAARVGLDLANFADNSAFVQLRYEILPDKLAVGGVVTYSSEMYAGQPDGAADYNGTLGYYNNTVPDYTTLDLFATYDLTERASLRLNVGNVTDEDYYLTGYRSGAFTYIGDRRNAQLTLSLAF